MQLKWIVFSAWVGLAQLLTPLNLDYTLGASGNYKGVAYSGFRKEGPPTECLTEDNIRQDMELLSKYGIKWIRTYSIDLCQDLVCQTCTI